MSTLVYNIKYRPMRIGWCVRNGDFVSLKRALQLTHCLWGGRFNPVITVDDKESAGHLIECFHVDALLSPTDEERCRFYAKSIKHLPWPLPGDQLFEDFGNSKACVLLDIRHPVRRFYEDYVSNKLMPGTKTLLCNWVANDPCAAAFEAMFGSYPLPEESGLDYRQIVLDYAAGKELAIAPDGPVDGAIVHAQTPNGLTALELKREIDSEIHEPGLFVGEANNFAHVVEFWNLRAAGLDVLFFDPRHQRRFRSIADALAENVLAGSPSDLQTEPRLTLWLKAGLSEDELKVFKTPLLIRNVNASVWEQSAEHWPPVNPASTYFSQRDAVAQVAEGDRGPIVTIQLDHKPGFDELSVHPQRLVATLRPSLSFSLDDRFLFKVPHIPELNEFFGRNHHISWNEARAEKNGLGILTDLGTEHITLFGMERFSFFQNFFKTFGIGIELRQPGLVCEQLIRQMGGLQGCRVFKIEGVRKLIERFGPTQTFTRSEAMQLIGNVHANVAHFAAYESLYIEPRERGSLKPEDVFAYLLKKGVFRVGVELQCTSCQLKFWLSLDETRTLVTCEYCGHEFNVAPQLKGEKWVYRPSGLFGRADHQEGGVPVALTLQQFDTVTHSGCISWMPALNLNPQGAAINPCETDFVFLHQNNRGRVQLLIGECKANQEISDQDVQNLSSVARALPAHRLDVFMVFAKAGKGFSPQEIQRCLAEPQSRQRTILLSKEELEPYFVYERHQGELSSEAHAYSFEGMVRATQELYLAVGTGPKAQSNCIARSRK